VDEESSGDGGNAYVRNLIGMNWAPSLDIACCVIESLFVEVSCCVSSDPMHSLHSSRSFWMCSFCAWSTPMTS
jgi:hypothetical protein